MRGFEQLKKRSLPARQVPVFAYGSSEIILKDLTGRTNGRAGRGVLEEETVAPAGGYSW